MANLSSLSTLTTTATALSNLILVSPQATIGYQPQNNSTAQGQKQPPAILFHYEGEQSVELKSDITDHYVEDNTAIQDQIALRPEMISTHGFIGELNDVTPAILTPLKDAADKLTVIDAYTPALSTTALIAYAEAFQLYQVAANASNNAVASWNALNGTGFENIIGADGLQPGIFNPATGQVVGNQTKQQVAFQQFYGYWRARTLFTVQTPWAVFKDMAIESLRPVQDAETRMITDFHLTFKMIRTAVTASSPGTPASFQNRAATQNVSLTDLGTSPPVSSISVDNGLSQMGVV